MELCDIANELVLGLSRKSVFEQLKSLGIAAISLEILKEDFCGRLATGVISYTEKDLWHINTEFDDNSNSIFLNKDDSVHDRLFTIGHELGHIFCNPELAKRILVAYSKKYRIEIPESEEYFCEIFSSLWVSYGTNKKELLAIISALSLTNHKIILREGNSS